MIVSINQPAYLPWLGYFDRIAKSDVHVVLDSAQFEKNSVTNRNKLRTKEGWCWVTVPLRTSGRFGNLKISDAEIAEDGAWRRRHLNTISFNYGKAPYIAEHLPFAEDVYTRSWTHVWDLIRETTGYLTQVLSIDTPLLLASELGIEERKSELILAICRRLEATTYLSGPFGRDYLDLRAFDEAGVEVQFHDYKHPRYPQVQGGFEPFMSTLDLILNCGPASRDIITQGGCS